ncbi:glutamate--tRNA ligase [Candidatus Parcubacteria bacterium]|nr:glutamate--tRNA ligase [Candidatus Parcubacteria bacterium]
MTATEQVRVRIAPSPTGALHIGTARTALFNFLFARKHGGKFVLRIEDTDLERSDSAFEKDIVEGLRWLGVEWDEGVERGGEYGPYRQSERRESYEKYVDQLLAAGQAYYCYCTEEELEAQRQDMAARGEAPRYSGRCRNLDAAERQKFEAEGRSAVVRFRAPEREVSFHDLIRSKISFDMRLNGDFSIAKFLPDGSFSPLYNFAVVVDDAAMAITHVIRGEDHISNTPKQLVLQEALGFPHPHYAHLPLILGPDRSKLSKRHGATAITEFREAGYLPQAMVNFMAFLGWNPGGSREFYTLEELADAFSLEKVQKAGAVFNASRLDWFNAHYIRAMAADELVRHALPFLLSAGLLEERGGKCRSKATGETVSAEFLAAIVTLEQSRMKRLAEIAPLTEFFFVDIPEYDAELMSWKGRGVAETRGALDAVRAVLEAIPAHEFSTAGLSEKLFVLAAERGDKGTVLWPLRVALTGREASPDPIAIAAILGKEKTLRRIEAAIVKLS